MSESTLVLPEPTLDATSSPRASVLRGVPQTLLITLVARARAGRFCPDLGFTDPWAQQVLAQLDVDADEWSEDPLSMRGAVLRTLAIDRLARAFFERHPEGCAVNLGAGLCTRFQRLDNGRLHWIDLDLPEVIGLRSQLLPAGARRQALAGSAADLAWVQRVPHEPGRPLLLVAEGLLMYLSPAQVRALFMRCAEAFAAPCEFVCDYTHPWVVSLSPYHPAPVRRTGSRFFWGQADARTPESWSPRWRLLDQHAYLHGLGGWFGGLASVFRGLTRRELYGLARYALDHDDRRGPAVSR